MSLIITNMTCMDTPRKRLGCVCGNAHPLPSEKWTTCRFQAVLPEGQDQNRALTVLYVSNSLDSGSTLCAKSSSCSLILSSLELSDTQSLEVRHTREQPLHEARNGKKRAGPPQARAEQGPVPRHSSANAALECLRGQQMPSPRPWKMIRYFHSTHGLSCAAPPPWSRVEGTS